ncbi:MAG: hypothetical protein ACT4OV_13940 [Microthrixaceae bacterium]
MSRLRWHVAALVLGVVVTWPVLHLDDVFSTDEGAYAVQARALRSGGWDVGYAFAPQDPTGRFQPAHGAITSERGSFWYVQHPLWPTSLAAGGRAVGEQVGLRLAGVASLVALAVTCWALAREVGQPRASPWAFWIAASSPVLANAWILWAHAPSAAAAALLLLSVLKARHDRRWLLIATAAAALGVLLRSEGLLWAGAVLLGVVAVAWFERARAAWLAAAGVAVAATAALVAERSWTSSIVGNVPNGGASSLEGRAGGASLRDRLVAARIALVDGAILDDPARLMLLALVAGLGAAVILWRRHRDPRWAFLAVACAGPVLLLRWVAAPADPSTGLFAAAPILVLALAWSTSRGSWAAVLPIAGASFTAVVLGTQYADGGSFQWGGRFLSPLVPVLAVAAACVLVELLHRDWSSERGVTGRRLFATGAAGLLAAQVLVGLGVTDRIRRDNGRVVERIDRLHEEVMISSSDQAARLDWRAWPDRCWVVVPEPDATKEVVAVLRRAGVERVGYAGIDPEELARAGLAVRAAPGGGRLGTARLPRTPTEHAFVGCR